MPVSCIVNILKFYLNRIQHIDISNKYHKTNEKLWKYTYTVIQYSSRVSAIFDIITRALRRNRISIRNL